VDHSVIAMVDNLRLAALAEADIPAAPDCSGLI
jgi:hypothetical protein